MRLQAVPLVEKVLTLYFIQTQNERTARTEVADAPGGSEPIEEGGLFLLSLHVFHSISVLCFWQCFTLTNRS